MKLRRRTRKKRRQQGGQRRLKATIGTTVLQGQRLSLTAARAEPTVTWSAPPLDAYVTLVCHDPDATASAWLHWLVVNCTGTDPNSGDTRIEWAPPTPPPGTGVHRYILQTYTHTYKIPPLMMERGYFNHAEFARTNRLSPLAQTSFTCAAAEAEQNTSSV